MANAILLKDSALYQYDIACSFTAGFAMSKTILTINIIDPKASKL